MNPDKSPPIRAVAALVVDYQSTDDARRLTLQLARALHPGFEMIIYHIDNGNLQPLELSHEQVMAKVTLLRVAHNDGYAAGLIAAIAHLRSQRTQIDAFWFLNSDLEIEANCLEKLVALLDREPRAGAVGPRVYTDKERTRVWGARGVITPLLGTTAMVDWHDESALPRWSYIPGCSLLARASAYSEAGGLPARYRMYYEETELCVRMQRANWSLFVVPEANAFHFSRSTEGRIPAKHFAYYFARNNIYFWKNNFSIPPWLQLPRTLYVALKELILPLRRVPNSTVLKERLGYVIAGLLDSFQFLKTPHTKREARLFPETSIRRIVH